MTSNFFRLETSTSGQKFEYRVLTYQDLMAVASTLGSLRIENIGTTFRYSGWLMNCVNVRI